MQWVRIVSAENTKKTCDFFHQHNFQAKDSGGHNDAHNGHSLHNAWLAVVAILHNTHSVAIWLHPEEVWLESYKILQHLLHQSDFLNHFLFLLSVSKIWSEYFE